MTRKNKPIYVGIDICSDVATIWEKTQTPQLHEQWDLRFSKIEYLPRNNEENQRFLYATRIGFGIQINGEGETVGEKMSDDGGRTSSLKFWSIHPLSLIREGSGYWKYISQKENVYFYTWYDYMPRFGFFGRILDRFIFRPIMGWATAWSFDCLRLWVEKEISPKLSVLRLLIQTVCLLMLSFVWVYQGIVPKLLFQDSGEKELIGNLSFLHGHENWVLFFMGIGEILFGISFWIVKNKKTMYFLNIFLMILLMIGAAVSQPHVFAAPFNPLTLNLLMIGLSIIGVIVRKDIPSALNCIRKSK